MEEPPVICSIPAFHPRQSGVLIRKPSAYVVLPSVSITPSQAYAACRSLPHGKEVAAPTSVSSLYTPRRNQMIDAEPEETVSANQS